MHFLVRFVQISIDWADKLLGVCRFVGIGDKEEKTSSEVESITGDVATKGRRLFSFKTIKLVMVLNLNHLNLYWLDLKMSCLLIVTLHYHHLP